MIGQIGLNPWRESNRMDRKINILKNQDGQQIVMLPEIVFTGKQKIDWKAVERYLQQYVGSVVTIAESKDVVYIGEKFPDEYKGSAYTKSLRGAKANAAQGILELVEIAGEKRFCQNRKEKHAKNAKNGWYYYTVRFALPIYKDNKKTKECNIYSACLLVNCESGGKMYLYDIVDIKKEASTPLRSNE